MKPKGGDSGTKQIAVIIKCRPYKHWEVTGIIDFSPLWATMKEKNITQYQLIKSGIDNKTLDSLRKNKNITLATLESLCRILDCTPNDVVRFIDEPEPGSNSERV